MATRLAKSNSSSNGFAEHDAATFLNTVDGTVPPSSFITEQNTVAAVMVNPDNLPIVRGIMPDMMAIRDPQLRAMYHAICWMAENDQFVDPNSYDEVLVQSAMTKLGYETSYKINDALREKIGRASCRERVW